MSFVRALLIGAGAAALAGGAASAQEGRWAAGAHLGSTGIGAEAFFAVNDMVVVRGGGDWGKFNRELDSRDINYDGEASWRTFGLAVDLHPMRNPFFVSAGVFAGERKVEVDAVSSTNQTINGISFTPAQLGTITGEGKLSDAAPFLGLGWDNTFHGAGSWGFRALAGIAFSDSPDVNLVASGPFAGLPAVQDFLRQEERDLEDDAELFKTYPVLSVGLNYRF